MRLCRLAVLLAVFAGISMPAAAQYTTKGAVPQSAVAATTAPSAPTAKAVPARKEGSGFTSQSASSARSQAKPAASQAVFRPRPKEETPPEKTEEEDELPSFEALEGNAANQKQQENVPPPPPPKGEIWLYLAGFEYSDLTGKTMNCSWKVVVQNRTDTRIDQLNIAYQMLDESVDLYLQPIEPNSSSVEEQALYSPKCPAMARIKPKINIKKCKFGTLANQECLSYIIVK